MKKGIIIVALLSVASIFIIKKILKQSSEQEEVDPLFT